MNFTGRARYQMFLTLIKVSIMLSTFFYCSEGIAITDLQRVSPRLIVVLGDLIENLHRRGMPPLKMTSIIRDKNSKIKSASRTHQEGRAIDISIMGWDVEEADDIVHDFNSKYEDIAAISASDGVPRLMLLHNSGYGPHIHIQVRRMEK